MTSPEWGETEWREATAQERKEMMRTGVFDINGNIPAHPGYTGIHRLQDGSYYLNPYALDGGRAATEEESQGIDAALAERETKKSGASASEPQETEPSPKRREHWWRP